MSERKERNRVIAVTPETLKKAKIRATQRGETIKEYVTELIEKDVTQQTETTTQTTTRDAKAK